MIILLVRCAWINIIFEICAKERIFSICPFYGNRNLEREASYDYEIERKECIKEKKKRKNKKEILKFPARSIFELGYYKRIKSIVGLVV